MHKLMQGVPHRKIGPGLQWISAVINSTNVVVLHEDFRGSRGFLLSIDENKRGGDK